MKPRDLIIAVVIAALGTAVVVAGILMWSGGDRGRPLPVLSTVPPFELTAQTGEPITRGDLDGQPWVANFVLTRCTLICPFLTRSMFNLQTELDRDDRFDGVRLVSFSVDPGHDTPAVLTEYARQHGADADRWTFVTGEVEAVRGLIRDGFLFAVEDVDPDDPSYAAMPVTHTEKFALVDGSGEVRGHYNGRDDAEMAALVRDLKRLLDE